MDSPTLSLLVRRKLGDLRKRAEASKAGPSSTRTYERHHTERFHRDPGQRLAAPHRAIGAD